ncbi:MAG: sulfite exporter TauE/SafE family protein [Hyphomicrobiales bacterium]|nr:sulfite exporter TauE/SafE family protein [Hyphomicrobiales bacterium]
MNGLDWTFYLAAIPAVILFGLSKGGFSALGSLAIPVFALAISPVKAAAITLPLMIVQDWVAVWAFRRDFDARNLVIMLPGSLLGVGAGFLLASHVDEDAVRLAVGIISIGFVLFMLARDRIARGKTAAAPVAPGVFWGALSGFTSFVSHAGGPPMMIYVLPQKLAPRIFAGTSTMFFAATNLLKVPPYFALGQFSADNLFASATLFPVAIASTFAGVWLVRRVSAERFYAAVLLLTFLIGLKLSYDGLRALLA